MVCKGTVVGYPETKDMLDPRKNILAEGGEGRITRLENGLDVKWYLNPTESKLDKVDYQVLTQPRGGVAKSWMQDFSWPRATVVDEKGDRCGYVMKHVDQAITLKKLLLPTVQSRLQSSQKTLAHYMREMFRILARAHQNDIVVADLTPANVMVDRWDRVTLIDCDAFQIDRASTYYQAGVATAPYGAPELIGNDLAARREKYSDIFSAVAVLHEVMAYGQFHTDGRITHCDDIWPPDRAERVSLNLWPGSTKKGLKCSYGIEPLPSSVDFRFFGPEMCVLITRAFDDGALNPKDRPTAVEFMKALDNYIAALVACHDGTHLRHRDAAKCYWCEREARLRAAA